MHLLSFFFNFFWWFLLGLKWSQILSDLNVSAQYSCPFLRWGEILSSPDDQLFRSLCRPFGEYSIFKFIRSQIHSAILRAPVRLPYSLSSSPSAPQLQSISCRILIPLSTVTWSGFMAHKIYDRIRLKHTFPYDHRS